jgi:hypothetical protein
MASGGTNTINFILCFLLKTIFFEEELVQIKEISVNFLKRPSWKDPSGISVDNDVANKPYRIN